MVTWSIRNHLGIPAETDLSDLESNITKFIQRYLYQGFHSVSILKFSGISLSQCKFPCCILLWYKCIIQCIFLTEYKDDNITDIAAFYPKFKGVCQNKIPCVFPEYW